MKNEKQPFVKLFSITQLGRNDRWMRWLRIEPIGNNTSAGLELMHQSRPQSQIPITGKIESHNRRGRKVGGHKILLVNLHQLFHSLLAHVFARQFNQPRINFEANGFYAKLLCRGDDHPTVSGPEIVDDISLPNPRKRQ